MPHSLSAPAGETDGRAAIANAFDLALSQRRAALMPYYTLGYPDRSTSLDVVEAFAPYCDLMELGVPFSDPLADGPTIQNSTQVSLQQGTTVAGCLSMLQELRARSIRTPALLMGYFNPILAYGQQAFVADAAAAGAQGILVPDLPPEESVELEQLATAAGLVFVHFLAPTSNDERIKQVVRRAQGFIYLVSVAGVTGARSRLTDTLPAFVARVRRQIALAGRAQIPLAVGFGISTAEQAASVGELVEGVIVGSALINAVDAASAKSEAAANYVRSLYQAL